MSIVWPRGGNVKTGASHACVCRTCCRRSCNADLQPLNVLRELARPASRCATRVVAAGIQRTDCAFYIGLQLVQGKKARALRSRVASARAWCVDATTALQIVADVRTICRSRRVSPKCEPRVARHSRPTQEVMMEPVLRKAMVAVLIAALAGGTAACKRSGTNDTAGTAGMSGPAATSNSVAPPMGGASAASQ